MQKGQIRVQTENIFPIIKKFLYSDHEIFLRELVSNAVDASQKIKTLSSIGEAKGDLGELRIDVVLDAKEKTLSIIDRGVGMTSEEVDKYINQVAFSGAEEFMDKYKDANIIGHFGLGFYSAFMVSDKVELYSKSFKDASGVFWGCDGNPEFELYEVDYAQRGTKIVLHISEESKEFLEASRVKAILDRFCKFLPIPIYFSEVGVQEEGEKKDEIVEEKSINNPDPIWVKKPSELTKEDYEKFYKELYPFGETPLFWIHLNVDYPFNLTGVLYFPKVKNDFELQRNKIKLFSRQVFITDEVKDIVPEFLMLLHGVIDSPDIPLNVSRSFLQADGNVKKINNYITKKVADKLSELFKKDRKEYESKWGDIGLFVKYGMISEEKFYEKGKEFTLLKNTKEEHYTLDEYREKVLATQTDKNEQLVYLYSTDLKKQDSFIDSALKKEYDVLVLDSPIDNHFIQHIESKLEKTQLKRVDSDVVEKLIQKDSTYANLLSEDQSKSVKELFEKAIANKTYSVDIEGLSPEEMPVTITMEEWMRRMKEMAQTGGGPMSFYGSLPDSYKVAINGNHPLVDKILKAENEESQVKLAKQAFDLALLSQGLLTGKDLTAFVKRSVEMI